MIRQLALLCVLAVAIAVPARADGPSRVFVASTGDDANDGSRFSPKRSFQSAHDAVASFGTIAVLDTAGYGTLSITKSVSIIVPPGVSAFVPVPTTVGGAGIRINAPNGQVKIRGLTVEGSHSNIGILTENIGTLVVQDTVVRNVGGGIFVAGTSNSTFVVQGGSLWNVGEGIVVSATSSNISVSGVISDVTISSTDTDAIRAGIYGSNTTGSTVKTVVRRCTISDGFAFGIWAERGAEIVLDDSIVTGQHYPFQGAPIYSRGNNTVYNNQDPGYALTPLPAR